MRTCCGAASEAVFENVPASVPTLAIAMTVMFSDTKNKEQQEMPTWCRFLCKKAGPSDDPSASTEEQSWLPNNDALEALISMRPLYFLDMLCKVMGGLEKKGSKARFADFQASRLTEVCGYLMLGLKKDKEEGVPAPDQEGKDGDGNLGLAVVQLEILLATMIADETDWAASWSKLLTYCLADSKLTSDELKDRMKKVSLTDLDLDVPPKFKYLLGGPSQIKKESLSPEQVKRPSRAASSDDPFLQGENVLDVMSLQMQLTSHLLAKAPESQWCVSHVCESVML